MLRRIALDWDIASISIPLVGFRVHGETASAGLGSFTGLGYAADDSYAQTMLRQRRQFLDEANFSRDVDRWYRSIAETSFRRDRIQRLADQAGLGRSWRSTNADLLRMVRADPRSMRLPVTWKLITAQLGARTARRFLRRVTHGKGGLEPGRIESGGPPR